MSSTEKNGVTCPTTNDDARKAVWGVIGALMDAGWLLSRHESAEVRAKGEEMIEEAKLGGIWVDEFLNGGNSNE